MEFDWWTLAIQAVNFLVLVWLLNRLLYRPVRSVIDRRREAAERALQEAEAAARASDAERARLAALEDEIEAGRQKALAEFHVALQAERKEVLRKAGEEAAGIVQKAHLVADEERQKALKGLKREIAEIAADMAAKIIAGDAAERPAAAGLPRASSYLGSLPEDELAGLREDVSTGDRRVVVTTAAPLSDTEKADWRGMLEGALGAGLTLEFRADPEILGGADIRFPHSELRLSWAHFLGDATEELLEAGDVA